MLSDFKGNWPNVDPKSFIADGAKIIGNVTMKEYSSVWYNSIVRGDINRIEIGAYTNIQDGTVIHVAPKCPAIIGDFVTVGHSCVIHGCTVEEHCIIGMGAVILDGAVIGKGSIVAAGAVVLENQVIPPHSLVAGVPAKIHKSVPEKWSLIHEQAVHYKTIWTKGYGIIPDADGEEYHGE